MTSEQQARERIDELLKAAGWTVRDPADANANICALRSHATLGIPMTAPFGSLECRSPVLVNWVARRRVRKNSDR
jgi:hypothetical protein